MTPATLGSPERTWWQWLAHLAKRAVLMEIHAYQSIFRFVFRRPRVPAGTRGFPYHQPILSILIVIISVSALEVVVADLIVHRWPMVRIPLLILGIWGVVWMLGMLFGILTRPHVVGPEGVRARYAAETDIPISWADVHSVARRKRIKQDGERAVTEDGDGERTLHLRISNETNIEIELERPTPLRTPRGVQIVRRVAIWVDDPTAYLDEVRRHIS